MFDPSMKLHDFTVVVSSFTSAESTEAYPPSAKICGGADYPFRIHPLRRYVGVLFCEGG